MAHWLVQKLPVDLVHKIYSQHALTKDGIIKLRQMAVSELSCFDNQEPHGIKVLVTAKSYHEPELEITDGLNTEIITLMPDSFERVKIDDRIVFYVVGSFRNNIHSIMHSVV